MTFRIGQKVVCVDESGAKRGGSLGLRKGAIYTIVSVGEFWDGIGVDLAELPAPMIHGHHQAYNAARFRPIVEHKTDIGFAHEILCKASKRVDA
jgi:hypothetical protein